MTAKTVSAGLLMTFTALYALIAGGIDIPSLLIGCMWITIAFMAIAIDEARSTHRRDEESK